MVNSMANICFDEICPSISDSLEAVKLLPEPILPARVFIRVFWDSGYLQLKNAPKMSEVPIKIDLLNQRNFRANGKGVYP